MSNKCRGVFDNDSFIDDVADLFYTGNYFEQSAVSGTLSKFTWELIKLIKDRANDENFDLTKLTEEDKLILQDCIIEGAGNYADNCQSVNTLIQNINGVINLPDLQAKLSDALNPMKLEEATYASSFLVEKIGNGFESKAFQNEVANKLFELMIWDKDTFVVSCSDIYNRLKKYRQELESSFGNSFDSKKMTFLNILDNFDLAKDFENKASRLCNEDISQEEFKKLFQLYYLDDFINLYLSGFIAIDPQYYNKFDADIATKYSYNSQNKIEFLGEDEFVDLNTNTEKLIKLFITNFDLYSYKSGLPLNQKFQLNSWAEANAQIRFLAKSYENQDLNSTAIGLSSIDYLKQINTINGQLPSADAILLQELSQMPNFKIAHLIQSEKHPNFYIKYFLQLIMRDGNSINPKKLTADNKQTRLQTIISDNKFNYVYSLYKNLFDSQNSIYVSDLKVSSYYVGAPQYLSALCQNLLTTGNVEIVEIVNDQGALSLVNAKDKQYAKVRRDWEKQINESNLNSIHDTNISFEDFIKSIDENISIEYNTNSEGNKEFLFKEKVGEKEHIYCKLKFGDDLVKFSFTHGNTIADWDKVAKNVPFQKLIESLLHITYNTDSTMQNAINADIENNLPALATLCFDTLAAQYSRRDNKDLPKEISYRYIYGTAKPASITSNRTSFLQQIANIISAVEGKEDLTVTKDINKDQISSVVLGNLAGSPMCFPSSCKQNLSNPTSEFKLTSADTSFEVKNIRNYQDDNNEGVFWGKTSSSDMFAHVFLHEYISGFLDPVDYSYNATNGKRIGAPTCVNSDKPLFGQGFINTDAKIFNGKNIQKASADDISQTFKEDMISYYNKLTLNLRNTYNRDVANCNKTLNTNYELIADEEQSLATWYQKLVKFYSNSEIISQYNLSLNRVDPIIEANNVFHTNLNTRLLNDYAKFLNDEEFEKSIELGNLFFVHNLLTNETEIPQIALSEKDRTAEKLKSLQGNNRFAFDLTSVETVDFDQYASVKLPSNFNSFFDSNLNYILSRKFIKSIHENSNIIKSGNIEITYKDDSGNLQSFKIDESTLSKFICHKQDTYMPIAKVSYSDNNGKTYHRVLSTSEDFYQFVDHLSQVKNYKLAQDLFEKPLNVYHPELNVEVQINPVLAKYNAFATFMQQEYILTQDGSNLAHKTSGNPNEERFVEEYPFLENSLIENNPNLQLLKKIAQHDIEMGFGDKTQQKRNNQNTAQMKLLNTDVITGMNEDYKVAIIADPKTLGFSPNGTNGSIKILDGCTFISGSCARAINESLGAARVGMETMKLYSAQYKDIYGIGSNNKTANFTLTNEKIREDEFYQRMAFNMMKHTWRKKDNTLFTPDDLFKSSLNGASLLSKQVPFFYKVNDRYYMRSYLENNHNGSYKFQDVEVDINGNVLGSEATEPFDIPISDNFDLYLALGGWNSCSLLNGELVYSDWSQDKLFEIQVSITENGYQEGYNPKYKCEVFQPLLASDIFMVLTEGAVKMTHTNIMPASVLFDNIYNEDGSFKSQSFYTYSKQDSRKLGPQLDKTHHADRSQIANMTQVISACIAQGYTPNQALSVYEALGTLSRLATKEFRNSNTSAIKSLDEDINQTVFNIICKYIINNKESELDTTLEILTRDIIKQVQKNHNYDCSELAQQIPLDSTAIYKKVISILGSTLTKLGIKLKVTGNLAVINPTEEIVKYYKIPYNLPENLTEDWIAKFETLCTSFSDISPKQIYNYLLDNSDKDISAATKEILQSYSGNIKQRVCRSSKIPGVRKNNSCVLYKNAFIDKVLSKLSDKIENVSDINIGSNYKITLTDPEDINNFYLRTSEKDRSLLEVQEEKDSNFNTTKLTFWANVGLPHYEIYSGKKHFVGQHFVKAILAKSKNAVVEKIYNKGVDLDFQNVNFKDIQGNKFELTDLFTVQVYCKLSALKANDLKRFDYYSQLIKEFNSEFKNYLQFYLNNELHYKKESSNGVTFANEVIRQLNNLVSATADLSNFCQTVDLDSIIKTAFNNHYPDSVLSDALMDKYKTSIQNILLEVCDRFLYKKHQDDLHALSKNSTLSEVNTEVLVVDSYDSLNWKNQQYKKVTVNKYSIENKVCGVIMPKTFRSVLHLNNDDTVQDILNDTQYFTKQLLKRSNCTLTNAISFFDTEQQKEVKVSTWDLCLKTLDGQQLYVKTRHSKATQDFFENDSSRFIPISTTYKDGDNKIWAKNIKTGKVIAQLYNENDVVYYDTISKNYIILTEGATLKDSEGQYKSLTDLQNFKDSGLTIAKNPFAFYLSTFNFNTFAINTEDSTEDTLTEKSLIYNLLDSALKESEHTKEFYSELSDNFEEKILQLDWLRDNKGELTNSSLVEYFQKQGKLLHQSFNKILDIIAARIPAQCLQSVMAMRVSDFIESDSSQALVSAYQFYLQGSDLDIDSVSLQTFSLNDNGLYQSHTPYYNLDFDEASQMLPFKPEIKSITKGETGVSCKELIDKYARTLTDKTDFYKSITALGFQDLVDKMFSLRDFLKEQLDNYNQANNTNYNYIEYNGYKYPIYKKGFSHDAPDAVIAAVTVAELFFENNKDTQYASLLREAKRQYYQSIAPDTCFEIKNNKLNLLLETEDQIKTFAKFLNEFSENKTTIIEDSPFTNEILRILNKHFGYYHKLSEKNKTLAALNFEFNNLRSITLDTSHMSESLASIDVIVNPVKDNANKQKQATRGWYSTTSNCMNVHSGVEVNMTGKDDIAICAVAEKHYFALQGAFQAVLNGNDEDLKKMLIAGLGWAFESEKEKEKALKDTKVANKYCNIISNAFDAHFVGDFVDGQGTLQLLKTEQESIDTLLKQLVQTQLYNKNAALIISALLTLSTDNAKELVLGKINAGTATIDLYLIGAVAGFNINELMTIINSDYGQEVSKMLTDKYYAGKPGLSSALEATQLFENIPSYVNKCFKNKSIDLFGYIQENCQPQYIINQIIANNLYLTFNPESDELSQFLNKIKTEKKSYTKVIDLDSLSDEAKKRYKEWQMNPIGQVFKLLKATIKTPLDQCEKNYENQKLIQKYIHEFNLKTYNDNFEQDFLIKLNEQKAILEQEDSSDSLQKLKEINTVLSIKDDFYYDRNGNFKSPGQEFKYKEYLEETRYQIPEDDMRRRVYRDIYRIVQNLRTTSLNKGVSNKPMPYNLFLGNPSVASLENTLDMNEVFNSESEANALRMVAVNNKLKLRANQVWDIWLQRIRGCSLKYSKYNLGGDVFNGYYSIPKAFNDLALRAREFSLGSKLLINKEVPTKPEDINKLVNRFELVFKDQLSLYTDYDKFENSKYLSWIKTLNSTNQDEFLSQYIVFNEEGLPTEGIRLNLRNFLYDPVYQKNCLDLMNELKIFINILLAPSQLPHYRSYMETLLALKTCQDVTLTSLVDRFFTDPLIERRKAKDPFTSSMHKKTYALMENLAITSFLKSLNLTGSFREGTVLRGTTLQNAKDLNLSTTEGQQDFVAYFESKIGMLKQKFPQNLFIKKLMPKDVIYTLQGNTITPYTCDINMTPSKKAQGEQSILNQCKMHYLNLNKDTYSLNSLKEDIFPELSLNSNLNLADMFYIYSLLTTGNQASQVSLSQLVNIQISQPGGLAEAYMKHQASFNQRIINEYKQVVDSSTGNIDFTKAKELKKYILTLQNNSNLITPVLFINDNTKAGTDVILKDGVNVEYWRTIKKSKGDPEDESFYDFEIYDNDILIEDNYYLDEDYINNGPVNRIHAKSNREKVTSLSLDLLYGEPVFINLADINETVEIKSLDDSLIKIKLNNYIIANKINKILAKGNENNLLEFKRERDGGFSIIIKDTINESENAETVKEIANYRLTLFKLISGIDVKGYQTKVLNELFAKSYSCPLSIFLKEEIVSSIKNILTISQGEKDLRDNLSGINCK